MINQLVNIHEENTLEMLHTLDLIFLNDNCTVVLVSHPQLLVKKVDLLKLDINSLAAMNKCFSMQACPNMTDMTYCPKHAHCTQSMHIAHKACTLHTKHDPDLEHDLANSCPSGSNRRQEAKLREQFKSTMLDKKMDS